MCATSDGELEAGFDAIRRELKVPIGFPAAVEAEAEAVATRGPVLPPGAERDYEDRTDLALLTICLLYTSPSPRDATLSRMPSSA